MNTKKDDLVTSVVNIVENLKAPLFFILRPGWLALHIHRMRCHLWCEEFEENLIYEREEDLPVNNVIVTGFIWSALMMCVLLPLLALAIQFPNHIVGPKVLLSACIISSYHITAITIGSYDLFKLSQQLDTSMWQQLKKSYRAMRFRKACALENELLDAYQRRNLSKLTEIVLSERFSKMHLYELLKSRPSHYSQEFFAGYVSTVCSLRNKDASEKPELVACLKLQSRLNAVIKHAYRIQDNPQLAQTIMGLSEPSSTRAALPRELCFEIYKLAKPQMVLTNLKQTLPKDAVHWQNAARLSHTFGASEF